jgi:pimeloyl-ACP methyl ester carboxylesterase
MQVVYTYAGKGLGDAKLLRRLGRVRIPTLVLWGENDTAVTPAFGRAYADAFANARFQLIPGAAHIPVREAPEATFVAIDAFLAAT